jgi:hypothetical protein
VHSLRQNPVDNRVINHQVNLRHNRVDNQRVNRVVTRVRSHRPCQVDNPLDSLVASLQESLQRNHHINQQDSLVLHHHVNQRDNQVVNPQVSLHHSRV